HAVRAHQDHLSAGGSPKGRPIDPPQPAVIPAIYAAVKGYRLRSRRYGLRSGRVSRLQWALGPCPPKTAMKTTRTAKAANATPTPLTHRGTPAAPELDPRVSPAGLYPASARAVSNTPSPPAAWTVSDVRRPARSPLENVV